MADLGTLFQTAGLAPGTMSGLSKGILDRELANRAAQQEAETARYTASTPFELSRLGNVAEKARLDNLQGQADEAAGVYGANSNQKLLEAQQKAKQAQAAMEQMGPENTIKMLTATQKETEAVFGALDGYLRTFPSTGQAIDAFMQKFSQYTSDPQFKSAAAKYRNMPPEQAVSELTLMRNKIASANATAMQEQQAKLQQLDVQGQNALELQGLQNQGAAQAAGVKASAEKQPTLASLIAQKLEEIRKTTDPKERQRLEWELNYLKGAQVQTETNPYGLPSSEKSKAPPAYPQGTPKGTRENPIKLD